MKYIVTLTFAVLFFSVTAQTDVNQRTIEVRGSAELEIVPDEIEFIIGIEEYWEEEFEKNKDFEDYKTKVPLSEIEDAIVKNLREVGIGKDEIFVGNMGNYWRFRGKEFLYSKQLIVKITDFSKINSLAQITDARGIKYMNIGKLDHSNIEEYKKQVKIEALQAAKDKATYLLESIGEEPGDVITVVEMSDGYSNPMYASAMLRTAEAAPESVDQVQNITLSYQVRAVFAIKQKHQ